MGSEKVKPASANGDSSRFNQTAKSSPKQQGLMKCGFTSRCSNTSVSTLIPASLSSIPNLTSLRPPVVAADAAGGPPPIFGPARRGSRSAALLAYPAAQHSRWRCEDGRCADNDCVPNVSHYLSAPL